MFAAAVDVGLLADSTLREEPAAGERAAARTELGPDSQSGWKKGVYVIFDLTTSSHL